MTITGSAEHEAGQGGPAALTFGSAMAHPGGRPRKKFDLKKVELHGRLGSSFEDMAAMFDCSLATISLHMNDANSEFAKAYKRAQREQVAQKGKTD
jgi:hypothetical protein